MKGEITRKTVEGPALLIPKESEWVHKFMWHGSDPFNTNVKIPGALKFTKLHCVPDQLYLDVCASSFPFPEEFCVFNE